LVKRYFFNHFDGHFFLLKFSIVDSSRKWFKFLFPS